MIDAPHWEAIHPLFKRHQQQLRANLQIDMKDQFCTHRGESSTVPVVEDEDEDYIGEDLDDRDDYEVRIERSDFDRGVDDHEIIPIPNVSDMAECDEDDADATLLNQHVTNATPIYEPPASSFYENTWENMVDLEVAQEAFGSS